MNTVILAVFIASTSVFEAAVPVGETYRQQSFANSDEGIAQLGRWIEQTAVTTFDHVCVSGPTIEKTAALEFWSTRKAPVFFMRFADLQDYMRRHGVAQESAVAVAGACAALAAGRHSR